MKITINGKEYILKEPTKIIDLINNEKRDILACIVDNRLKDLNYMPDDGSKVELVDLSTPDGMWVYQSTLRYIICMAIKNIYKNAKVKISYSVSRTLYAGISNLDHPYTMKDFNNIKNEIERIISADYPIKLTPISKKDAIKLYEELGYQDKIDVLVHRKKNTLHIYKCQNYANNLYEFLMPSTGYVRNYKLTFYGQGFNISYPRYELDEKLPKFQEEATFREVLRESNIWSNIVHADSIPELRNIIENNKFLDLINLCETRHNRELSHLADKIVGNIEKIKLICVAGPSSSGKTTFTSKLKIELQSRGYEPFMISMDNFYKTKNYPKDKNGNDDYEHIKALDLNLFDKVIYNLITGNEVRLPKFIFGIRKREYTAPVKLKENQPILIEGIHGLNPLIAPSIMPENKFNIFISPITTIRIDDHSPISSTDLRLIRRMVRDAATRKTNPDDTLKQWKSVRNGEFKWIFPYQDNADFVFNSTLLYELCITSKIVLPLLQEVKRESPNYNLARRIAKMINYFPQVSDEWVPCNSLLREFIGGSIFYPDDKRK